jgi:hypothetical protein
VITLTFAPPQVTAQSLYAKCAFYGKSVGERKDSSAKTIATGTRASAVIRQVRRVTTLRRRTGTTRPLRKASSEAISSGISGMSLRVNAYEET